MIKLHKKLIRYVYSKFIATNTQYRTTSKMRTVGEGVTSAVYLINSNVIGKVSFIAPPDQDETQTSFTQIQADNKKYVWDYLQSKLKDKPAETFLSFPLYRAILKITDGSFLVTLEPYITGDTFYNMLNDRKLSSDEVADILIIIIDVLAYLGSNFGFNHNDFHLNNIMIVRADTIFGAGNNTYKSLKGYSLPKVKYFPVIIDYDWATIDCSRHVNRQIQCDDTVTDKTILMFNHIKGLDENDHSIFKLVHTEEGRDFGKYSTKVDLYALMLHLETYFYSLNHSNTEQHKYLFELVQTIQSKDYNVTAVCDLVHTYAPTISLYKNSH
jgi:hypothetical protein